MSPNASRPLGPYAPLSDLDRTLAAWARNHRGEQRLIGTSVFGRPIHAYVLGARSGPTIMLSSLIHGVVLF